MLYVITSCHDFLQVQDFGLPIRIASVGEDSEHDTPTEDGQLLDPGVLHVGAIASVVCSRKGKKDVDRFGKAFEAQFGTDRPAVIDVSDIPPDERVAAVNEALVKQLATVIGVQAERNVALSRDIAVLRKQHAKIQDAFGRLESYVFDLGLNHRSKSIDLMPASGVAPLELAPGAQLEQRLPQSSTGLSDIAISVSALDRTEDGLLTVTLLTVEDEQEHASWTLGGADLKEGWMRLALPVSLDGDARTPLLRLRWESAESLGLDWALRHPDPRFQAMIDGKPSGRTLALRCWTYVAGSEAPVSSDSVLPSGKAPRRRVIPGYVLASAENLTSSDIPLSKEEFDKRVVFREESSSLLVHVVSRGIAVARLAGAVPEGVSHVSASILSASDQAPDIDYALAIAPPMDGVAPGNIPAFNTDQITRWTTLPAQERGELHLYLPAPVDAAQDLYLMTRLSNEAKSAAFGWSTFSTITLHF